MPLVPQQVLQELGNEKRFPAVCLISHAVQSGTPKLEMKSGWSLPEYTALEECPTARRIHPFRVDRKVACPTWKGTQGDRQDRLELGRPMAFQFVNTPPPTKGACSQNGIMERDDGAPTDWNP